MSSEVPAGADPIARLVEVIREETGNVVPRARYGFLEEVLERRCRTLGLSGPRAYVETLAQGHLPDEWANLIPLVTVKESFFFRAPQQFDAILHKLLPQLLRARAAERRLRIWCVAAARGEEPATLAMLLADHFGLAGWDWQIVATDLDEDALAAARRGLYGERAVAQVPAALAQRWLKPRGALHELDRTLLDRIDYRALNLNRFPYGGLPREPFDLVLLRNVLIYFRRPLQRRVVAEVTSHLAPDGYLFLGASETLWQIDDRIQAVDLGDCFVYRRPQLAPPTAPASAAPSAASLGTARGAGRRGAAPKPVAPAPPAARGARAVLRAQAPAAAPASAAHNTRDLLLAATAALAAGDGVLALARVAEARALDAAEPAVYALEGFLHDLATRTEEAVTAYRAALFLDPTLFQVRVLLAELFQRAGDGDRATLEHRQVLTTLAERRGRPLTLFADLPWPDAAAAERRSRRALDRR